MSTLCLQTAAGLGRAAAVSLCCLGLGALSARLVAGLRRHKALAWTLLIAPCVTPALLIGYAWARVVLAATLASGWNELLYTGALILRLTPVAALALHFLPSPLSAEAWFCYGLLPGRRRLRWRALGSGPWIAAGLVFMLAFGEFELASMWSLKTWTVALFDAQVGGLALKETLHLAAWPALCEIAVLGALLALSLAQKNAHGGFQSPAAPRPLARFWRRMAWAYLGGAAVLTVLGPLGIVGAGALTGLPALCTQTLLWRDIGTSVFFALGAALLAQTLASLAWKRALWLGLPGMLGGLVLALLIGAGFQCGPALRALYDTPVPLLLAITLLILPLALGLRWLREVSRAAPALFVARMFRKNGRLLWQLDTRRWWWSLFLLFCWGYFEFTASSLLAPIGMTPVLARLHNLAHYGQTAVLSAMILAAVAVPVLVLLLTAAGRGLYARTRG